MSVILFMSLVCLFSVNTPYASVCIPQVTSGQGILSMLDSDTAVATKELLPLMGLLENSPVLCAYGLVR